MAPPTQIRGQPQRGQTQPIPPRPKSPLLKYIIFFLLALIVIVGLIILITWLVVRPKELRYSIEDGSINGYNFTKDNHLNANFHFVLKAENPNRRVSIYYDKIDVTVSYEDRTLATSNAPPFHQRKRDVTLLNMDLVAKDCLVDGPVGRDLCKEKASGDIKLGLYVWAKIRFKVGVFKIRRTLKADCGPLTVLFNKSKNFEKVYCDVDIDY